MNDIRSFQILRYLKRWLPLIICFFIGMTFFTAKFLSGRQSYTASAVIEYTNAAAKNGYAPDGSAIDVSEIASVGNMAKVLENLDMPTSYSLDSLCAGIKVEPVVEQQELNIQEAVNEDGKEYTVHSTSYIVSCTLGSSGSEDLARNILNELLDVYFSDYSNKHINQEQVTNETKDLIDTDYDYLEMVERLDSQLAETISTLHIRYSRDPYFRSAATGCSFSDLREQFSLIRDVDISRLYALILDNQITKDRALLLNKYQNRIANYNLTNQNAQEDIQDLLRIIDSYVDKMRESGNTDIDYNYILSDVYDREWERREDGTLVITNRTVQYDALLRDWVSQSDRRDYAEINAAYCTYIINTYQDGRSGGGYASAADVEQEIAAVIETMNELYDIVTLTNTEYNQYLGAQNIKMRSSVSTQTGFNMSVYLAITSVFFLLVGCCGAILLGRIGDILEYLFLRDSATGCMNRVCCDRYIRNQENRILPLGASCINIQITNQRELNKTYGREETDHAFREFGRVLRELFENRKNGFVGYNGGGQFWVFFEVSPQESFSQEICRLEITMRQALTFLPVTYQMGAINAGDAAVFHLRGLISGAVKLRRLCLTGIADPDGETREAGGQKGGQGEQTERKSQARSV